MTHFLLAACVTELWNSREHGETRRGPAVGVERAFAQSVPGKSTARIAVGKECTCRSRRKCQWDTTERKLWLILSGQAEASPTEKARPGLENCCSRQQVRPNTEKNLALRSSSRCRSCWVLVLACMASRSDHTTRNRSKRSNSVSARNSRLPTWPS